MFYEKGPIYLQNGDSTLLYHLKRISTILKRQNIWLTLSCRKKHCTYLVGQEDLGHQVVEEQFPCYAEHIGLDTSREKKEQSKTSKSQFTKRI